METFNRNALCKDWILRSHTPFFSAVRTEALPNKEHSQIATEQTGPKVDRYISVKGMSSCPQCSKSCGSPGQAGISTKGLARAILCHWPTISDV